MRRHRLVRRDTRHGPGRDGSVARRPPLHRSGDRVPLDVGADPGVRGRAPRARPLRGTLARAHARHASDALGRSPRARARRGRRMHAWRRRQGASPARGVRRRVRRHGRSAQLARGGCRTGSRSARDPRRGVHVGHHPRRPGPGHEAPARGRHALGDPAQRGVAGASPARRGGRPRARPPPRNVDERPVPLGARAWPERGDALDTPSAQAELLRHWLLAFGPATEADVRWWTGWTAREARAALAAVPHVAVDLDGAQGVALAGDLDPSAPASRGPRCCRHSTRRPWAGRSASGTSGRTARSCSTRTAMPARPCGGTGAWSAAGRSDPTARSSSGCSRTSVPTASARSRRRRSALPRGSATCAFSPSFLPPFQRALAR